VPAKLRELQSPIATRGCGKIGFAKDLPESKIRRKAPISTYCKIAAQAAKLKMINIFIK